ncbi:MAG: hypothetical protein EOP88_17165 [Verrucomicrobiaceae bacterium]|nr:MAG: hypothetical protein EOP88_17165 [Verrucomicrobiaceae bacterium]
MIKDHPDSPVKTSELQLDFTRRAFVVRNGAAFRVRSKMMETKPRKFVRWMELTECIGKAGSIPT